MARNARRASPKKVDAEHHVKQVTSDMLTGVYVDSVRSAVTFGTIAET
jgi:hypothetical protein